MCRGRVHQRMSEDRQTSVNDVREEWVDGIVELLTTRRGRNRENATALRQEEKKTVGF